MTFIISILSFKIQCKCNSKKIIRFVCKMSQFSKIKVVFWGLHVPPIICHLLYVLEWLYFLLFSYSRHFVTTYVCMLQWFLFLSNLKISFFIVHSSYVPFPSTKSHPNQQVIIISCHVIMCHRTDFHKEQWQYSGKSRVSLVCMHATQIVPRLFAHKPCELMIWCTATRLLCVNLTYTSLLLRLNWRNVEKWKSYEIWDREIFVRLCNSVQICI